MFSAMKTSPFRLLLAIGCLPRAISTIYLGSDQHVFKDESPDRSEPYQVAIIGAGAAGSSSAYYLAQYAQAAGFPINITIFERHEYIGGRSTTVHAHDDESLPIELGASIFVEVNQILVEAAKTFNLTTSSTAISSRDDTIPGADLAVWDGEKIVVSMETAGGWWDSAKLLYKYGFAPVRTQRLMKATTAKFFKMYDEPIFPFWSLTRAARDVGLTAVTASTGEQYLRENNIGVAFAREIIQASTRVNYAQNLGTIHGLETMVCMAAEGAMAVAGGNWQIFASMIAASNATTLLDTTVTDIAHDAQGQYTVISKLAGKTQETALTFDDVVVAMPFQFADISISEVDNVHVPAERPYVQLHVTLFTSPHLLSPLYFNLPEDRPAPKAVLTTLPQNEVPPQSDQAGSAGFFSISLLRAITSPKTGKEEYAYKIFSPQPVNATFLSDILNISVTHHGGISENSKDDITWIYRKVWNSYPFETPRDSFEYIRLDHAKLVNNERMGGIWYTSGIENFISTMETSSLMGKNVARLIVDSWMERKHDNDLAWEDRQRRRAGAEL